MTAATDSTLPSAPLWPRAALVAGIALMLSGCLAVIHEREAHTGGIDGALAEVVIGQTSADWLRDRLGPPDQIAPAEIGEGWGERWRYYSESETRTEIRALPLVSLSMASIEDSVMAFDIDNGVIVRAWQELSL